MIHIDLLCRTVDNFGDIGLVYRLARALSALPKPLKLRLIIDNFELLSQLAPGLDSKANSQVFSGWNLIHWEAAQEGSTLYYQKPADLVVECFDSGRPRWYEDLLFNPSSPKPRAVIRLEHLTPEAFVSQYHKLPVLTASPLVKKFLFLPGFTVDSGGLILDSPFNSLKPAETRATCRQLTSHRLGLTEDLLKTFWCLIFGYERDYQTIVRDLAAFNKEKPILVILAAGQGQESFRQAWLAAGRPFPVVAPGFLDQASWDKLLYTVDFSLVRGEDSFSRACLAGQPFIWQAYPQTEGYQLKKVEAFLKHLAFQANSTGPELAALADLNRLYRAINDRQADNLAVAGTEGLLPVLQRYNDLTALFRRFAARLKNQANLAPGLLSFFSEIG